MYMSKEQIRAELQGKTQEQIIEYVYCKNEEQENQNTLQGTLIHNALVKCQKYEEKIIKAKLRLLGTIDNDVVDINIDRHTNEIKLVRKGQSREMCGCHL